MINNTPLNDNTDTVITNTTTFSIDTCLVSMLSLYQWYNSININCSVVVLQYQYYHSVVYCLSITVVILMNSFTTYLRQQCDGIIMLFQCNLNQLLSKMNWVICFVRKSWPWIMVHFYPIYNLFVATGLPIYKPSVSLCLCLVFLLSVSELYTICFLLNL